MNDLRESNLTIAGDCRRRTSRRGPSFTAIRFSESSWRRLASLIVLVGTVTSQSASAADYFWDADAAANNLTTGAGLGGAGVWNTTSPLWWDTATSTDVVWPGAADRAVFWGIGDVVAVENISASGILIKPTTGSVTFTGNGGATVRTLTLGADGVVLESGAQATTLGNNTGDGKLLLALSANQSWLNNSTSLLTVNGTVNLGANTLTLGNNSTGGQTFNQAFSGSGHIVVDGAGSGETLFNGINNTFAGDITIRRGTLVAGSVASAIGPAGSTVTLGGGAEDAALRFQNGLTYGQKILVAAGAGKRTISSSTAGSSSVASGGITVDNDLNLHIAGAGTLNISGVLTGAGDILIDSASGATGYLQFAGVNSGYTGDVTIRSGLLRANGNNAALGAGTVYLGDTTTAGDALLQYTTNNSFNTPVVVAAGTGARAILSPSGGTNSTLAGTVTLNNDLQLLVAYTTTRNMFVSAAISGDHNITVSRMSSTTFGGFNVSGNNSGFTGSWTVEGEARLTFGGALNSAGADGADITLNAGTLAYSNANPATFDLGDTRKLTLSVAGGAYRSGETFTSTGGTLNIGTAMRIGGVVDGDGGLVKAGLGTLTLDNGANTYVGGTTIAEGTLNARSLGTGAVTFADGTTLNSLAPMTIAGLSLAGVDTINATNGDILVDGPVSGGGTLTLAGGKLTLAGDGSTFTGPIQLNTGTLQIGNGANGSVASTVLVNNGAVVFNRSNAYSYAGSISGNGTVAVTGAGATTLAGSNSYTGATTVEAGTLVVSGSLANTVVAVVNGAVLGGNGQLGGTISNSGSLVGGLTVAGAVTNFSDGTISPGGVGSVGTLTLGGLILGGGSLNFDLGALGPGNSDGIVITGGGALNVTAATSFNFNNLGGLELGLYDLITGYGSISGFSSLSTSSSFPGFALSFIDNNGTLQLSVDESSGGPTSLTWAGGNGNWGSSNYAGGATYADGDAVTFNDSPGTSTVTIDGGGVAPGSVAVDNNLGNTYVFQGGPITGATTLAKSGAGSLVLANDNSYTGATAVNAGTLEVQGAFATTSVAVAGNLAFNSAANQSIAANLTGAGTIQKLGAGTTTLNGANTFNGVTSVDAGRLVVASNLNGSHYVNGGGTLVANGDVRGVVVVNPNGTLQGTGSVGAVNVAAGGTLSIGNSVGELTIDGDDAGSLPYLTLNADSNLIFEFSDVNGELGTGWDYLELGAGVLAINAENQSADDRVNVYVSSLTLGDVHGLNNFNDDPATHDFVQEYYWKFIGVDSLAQIETTGLSSIGGRFNVIDDLENAGVFGLSDGNFYDRPTSSLGRGTFRVLAGAFDNQGPGLYIHYSAIPEPGSLLLAGIGSLTAGWYGKRRLKKRHSNSANLPMAELNDVKSPGE